MGTIEIILNNVLTALMRIHVSGEEAGLFDGAIQGIKQVINAIELAKEQEKKGVNADD